MVKISIFYPAREGGRFDLPYYLQTHMPMSIDRIGAHPGFRGVSVEQGLGGGEPGTRPTFIAACHFLFDSMEHFVEAYTPHAASLYEDLTNYTDLKPLVQINEVLLRTGGAPLCSPGGRIATGSDPARRPLANARGACAHAS
ncbi:EthD family reductase [Geothrix sp. 21YS21S-2]|uniref:EthD family reductase n=1 Tax=Geothrix sp. 21YS21S-2 TaxID=3068893 RepID=UPI0027BA11D8|nr:EthD family reductase [Geothrix sp. 21YS21S-2]